MPHMSGNELLEKLQLDIPSLCVTAIPEKASCNFSRVLAKPFRITELLSIVRELLPPKSSKGEDHNEQKSVP